MIKIKNIDNINILINIEELVKNNITYNFLNRDIKFKGLNGEIKLTPLPDLFMYKEIENNIGITPVNILKNNYNKIFFKKISGTYKALINNAITGINKKFNKNIRISGIGYKFQEYTPKIISVNIGNAKPTYINIPETINYIISKDLQKISFFSIDKEAVGLICNKFCRIKKFNDYKLTGIYYENAKMIKKEIKKKK